QLLSGYIQFKDKKYAEAVKEFSAVLKNVPEKEVGFGKYSDVLNTVAWAHYELKDYANAVKSFEKLLALHRADDVWAAPYDGLGWSYLKMGDAGQSSKMFQKSLQLAPGYASSIAGLAELKKK
ncbi:MAG: tetratricopeptide repeat protein, partial [Elusimicrobia bacterium]|nr:tetratricopeptide repeat protein [Elusimicrobiota bacterium]